MALGLAQFGMRVNAFSPGYLHTPMSEDSPEFVGDFATRCIPLGRCGPVNYPAPLFVFLASDGAAFITGGVLVIDGGQFAGQNASRELLRRLYPPDRYR
jgi:NAD(P)-dependent dehydrogenase (short-subunit alcohol dehydrogenase family)